MGPDRSHVGTYQLATINGRNLPGTIYDIGDRKVEIIAGTVELREDESFTNEIVFRTTEAGQVSSEPDSIFGSYTRSGSLIDLQTSEGFDLSLSYERNRLTQNLEGLVLVYVR